MAWCREGVPGFAPPAGRFHQQRGERRAITAHEEVIVTTRLWTMQDVCEFLGITRTTVYRLMEQGLPVLSVGCTERRRPRFDPEAVMKWLAARERRGPGRPPKAGPKSKRRKASRAFA